MDPEQNIKQKMITLAQSPDMVAALLHMMKMCCEQSKLVGDTEYETVRNAVKFDTQSNMIQNMVLLIDNIKQGSLHEPKP